MAQLVVLVTGLLPTSIGKTNVVAAIAAGLKREGVKVLAVKPYALFDWFTDYSSTLLSQEQGLPLSGDVVRLREAAGAKEGYTLLNPVSLVSAPLVPRTFIEARSPSSYYTLYGDPYRRLVLARTTYYMEGAYSVVYVNRWPLNRGLVRIDGQVLGSMIRRAARVYEFATLRDFREVVERAAYQALRSVLGYLANKYRALVIEGFSDLAWPLPADMGVSVVIAVAPGEALIYSADKYRMAVALKRGSVGGIRDVLLKDIFNLLNPEAIFDLPPVASNELPESLVEKYKDLIGYVLELLEAY